MNFSQERIKRNSHFIIDEFYEKETYIEFVKYNDFYSFNTNGLNYSEVQKLGFIIDLIVKAKYESYDDHISENDIKALCNIASNALTDLLKERLNACFILLPNTKPSSSELHTMLKHRCFLLQPLQRIILLLKLNVLHKVHKRKFG